MQRTPIGCMMVGETGPKRSSMNFAGAENQFWLALRYTCTVVSRKRAHGGAPYFRLRQGGGPTFVTSILQLYAKVRPDLHTL